MINNSFKLSTYILKSITSLYPEKKIINLTVKEKLGEGSYGIIYLIDNDNVIKIFKNSIFNNTILTESHYLIPTKNENRELIFFLKYVTNNYIANRQVINIVAIGIIKDIIIDSNYKLNLDSYFIILPYYTSFYKSINIFNMPLIEKKDGLLFTLKIMKRLLEISYFMENNYNLVNLDIKLNNFVFKKKKTKNLENLIMIDFGLIKQINDKKYKASSIDRLMDSDLYNSSLKNDLSNKYYLWPDKYFFLENLPAYSVCINGLVLLFGYDKILNFPDSSKIKYYLKIIKSKNKIIHDIFYDGLMLNLNTGKFIKLLIDYGIV
jgi:hypothetical protein